LKIPIIIKRCYWFGLFQFRLFQRGISRRKAAMKPVSRIIDSDNSARISQRTVTRHASFFRKVPPQHGCIDEEEEEREELPPPKNQVDPVPAEPAEDPPAAVPAHQGRKTQAAAPSGRNPGRQRGVPVRFRDDYILGSKR